ncbi:MAG: NAD(P)/FAD-dependent oxidoreductase [Desulfobacterales bacterium]|nr:NAD(P)/FAD-dependent oxidoreductase [Desulfobacterales bacterium]
MFDVIVIGSGYGGMSASALLGKAGFKVLTIESSTIIGGRAYSYINDEGYTCEYGAHSHRLREKGIANEVFKKLGDRIDFISESSDSKLIFKSKLYNRPNGPLGFLTTSMFSLWGRINLLIFLLNIKRSDPMNWYDKTLWEFYRTGLQNEEVENFLPFFGFTVMCPDPRKVSAGEVIKFLQRALAAGVGVGEPKNGSNQIFSKLKKHISKFGGQINLGEKVKEIMVEKGKVKGVITNKGKYESKKVVFAAPLPFLFETIDKKLFKEDFVKYSENIENSSSLTIDFILNKPVTSIRGSILGVDIPIWARFQSNNDTTFTPKGKYLTTWGIMLPWGFDGDLEEVEKAEKAMKDTISELFPKFFSHVLKEKKTLVPVMNGTVLTPKQSWINRPEIKCDTISGLYFVGDTVKGDGCSGDISFSSAMKVYDILSKEKK